MLRMLMLIAPVLMPSWRFFQTIEPSPRLEWRRAGGDWREYRVRTERWGLMPALVRLLWNPVWNEGLFLVSLAERIEENPTRHSVQQIEERLRRNVGGVGPIAFRLVFVRREGERLLRDVTFVSEAGA